MAPADPKYTFHHTLVNASYRYDPTFDPKASLKAGRTKTKNYSWPPIIRMLAIQWMFRNKILYMNNFAPLPPLDPLYEEFGLFEDNKDEQAVDFFKEKFGLLMKYTTRDVVEQKGCVGDPCGSSLLNGRLLCGYEHITEQGWDGKVRRTAFQADEVVARLNASIDVWTSEERTDFFNYIQVLSRRERTTSDNGSLSVHDEDSGFESNTEIGTETYISRRPNASDLHIHPPSPLKVSLCRKRRRPTPDRQDQDTVNARPHPKKNAKRLSLRQRNLPCHKDRVLDLGIPNRRRFLNNGVEI